jgi:hypothetical protein
MIRKIDAIISLVPNAQVTVRGEAVEWHEPVTAPVTETEITAEVARLQAEYERTEYQRKRAAEYPPMADYLDAVVKGDQAQIDAYIAACQAVKAKYPKPV